MLKLVHVLYRVMIIAWKEAPPRAHVFNVDVGGTREDRVCGVCEWTSGLYASRAVLY